MATTTNISACDGDPLCRKVGCETCDDHFIDIVDAAVMDAEQEHQDRMEQLGRPTSLRRPTFGPFDNA